MVLAAIIGASGGWLTAFFTRRSGIEARLAKLENHNRALWMYTRELIDHIYQQKPPPPPEPPAAVVNMDGDPK
jgi:hypothetical protein